MTVQKLVVTGSIAVDRIMNFSGHYPDIIHQRSINDLSVSVFLDSMRDAPGGVGANIAYSSALLGNEPVLLGSVGHDATDYITSLHDLGVDTSHVYFSKLPSASFNVITDGANRQIGGFYPGAMLDSHSLNFSPWQKDVFVVISPHDPVAMRRQVRECKARSLPMMYDVGQQITNVEVDDIHHGVDAAELLITNDYELSVLLKRTGLKLDELLGKTPITITTHGENGSTIRGTSVSEPILVKTARPKRVVDPTGAGDAYRAGFLHGYLKGMDVETCAQIGSVCGSFAVEQHGTQNHSYDVKSVATRYMSAYNKTLPTK